MKLPKLNSRELIAIAAIFLVALILASFLNRNLFVKSPVFFSTSMLGEPGRGLQLSTFTFFIPTPTNPPVPILPTQPPVQMCPHDNNAPFPLNSSGQAACYCNEYIINCENKKCTSVTVNVDLPYNSEDLTRCSSWGGFESMCSMTDGSKTGFCVAKPVIYLYPTEKTFVDVEVKTPGRIVVSDPLYPEGGWKDVLAKPDGNLVYQNKNYTELFYESEVNNFLKPANGIIIPSKELNSSLSKILFELGLNERESTEFTDFWIPKLKDLKSAYILFSIIDKNSKEVLDRVIISPEPDTRIEFIAYFKPLDSLQAIKPLVLPERPIRKGFTMVEWGGVLDNNTLRPIIQ